MNGNAETARSAGEAEAVAEAMAAAGVAFADECRACARRIRLAHTIFAAREEWTDERPGPAWSHVDAWDRARADLAEALVINVGRAQSFLTFSLDLVRRLPAVLEAMEAGRMDERIARDFHRRLATVDSDRIAAVQARAVAEYLGRLDRGERPGRAAVDALIDEVIEQLDAEALARRRKAAVRDRFVSFREAPDGMCTLYGSLTAAEGAVLAARLEHDAADALDREPDAGTSRGERLVDALVHLAVNTAAPACSTPGSDEGPGRAPIIRPQVTVIAGRGPAAGRVVFARSGAASVDALLQLLGACTGATLESVDPTPGAADHGNRAERRARTRTYRIAEDLKRRIRLRDGTCRHPGCSVRAEFCDVDHVRPFDHTDPSRGGPTAEHNLMCLCRRHHRFKTHGSWRYHLERDGTLTVVTDTGRRLRTRPFGPLARWRELEAHGRVAPDVVWPPNRGGYRLAC